MLVIFSYWYYFSNILVSARSARFSANTTLMELLPIPADGSPLFWEGRWERAWVVRREVVLHHCGLDPPEKDVGLNFLGLKRGQKFASFSTELRFIHKRGSHHAQKIYLKKTSAPHSLKDRVLEKDLLKLPLSLMHSSFRKAWAPEKGGSEGHIPVSTASSCFVPRSTFLWEENRREQVCTVFCRSFTFLCGCGAYMAHHRPYKSP